jgi:ubiquinone/menaquinone biosynthesis C-methylase UbiE
VRSNVSNERMKDTKYIPALGYDVLTPLYDAVVRLTVRERKFKKALIEQANFAHGQRVLDLACGTGTLAVLIKEMYPKVAMTGIDGDAKILVIAKRKALKKGADVQFDEGLSFALPYADESFERVVSSLFFHHLTRGDKLKTLREVWRVLKPEGELHIADWGLPSNFLMKVASRGIELLDGAETTDDNFSGLLPSLVCEAGFRETAETSHFNSLFGTVRLLKTKK